MNLENIITTSAAILGVLYGAIVKVQSIQEKRALRKKLEAETKEVAARADATNIDAVAKEREKRIDTETKMTNTALTLMRTALDELDEEKEKNKILQETVNRLQQELIDANARWQNELNQLRREIADRDIKNANLTATIEQFFPKREINNQNERGTIP